MTVIPDSAICGLKSFSREFHFAMEFRVLPWLTSLSGIYMKKNV